MIEPTPRPSSTEPTLDPTTPAEWESLRALGHDMVDEMLGWMASLRERKVWQPVPESVKERRRTAPPRDGQEAGAVFEEFRETVLPYAHGNVHPRYWGWVMGSGSPVGMLAEMLAAGMNSHATFGDQSAVHVEEEVLGWFKSLFGFPADATGVLTSGCTLATLTALTVARDSRAGSDVRRRGMQQGAVDRLVVYGSTETHSSVTRALELLGLGHDAFRTVDVDDHGRILPDILRQRIAVDRDAGRRPIAVVGTAGTASTGAMDDLNALASVCGENGLWFHVDGAFGALAVLSDELRPLVAGIERADSIAFDLHKWLHVPYDVGAVLVRDPKLQRESFALRGAYLSKVDSRLASAEVNYMELSPQMSRGFRALKVWMSIRTYGFDALGELIEQNVHQARHLAREIDAAPDLERLAPVDLNIVCFRYAPEGVPDRRLDVINEHILRGLHHDGAAVPSHTSIGGRFALRVAITNHRSRFEDFDFLVEEVARRGAALMNGSGATE